jgi:hypothetical protein
VSDCLIETRLQLRAEKGIHDEVSGPLAPSPIDHTISPQDVSGVRSMTAAFPGPAINRLTSGVIHPHPVKGGRWYLLDVAMRDGRAAPGWSASRVGWGVSGSRSTPGARAQALVHAPAAFRRRGVFVADYEIDAA